MRERVKERQIKTMRVSVREAERERHTEVAKLYLEKQPRLVNGYQGKQRRQRQ